MATKHHPLDLDSNPNSIMPNNLNHDDLQDTISLCDLPIYGSDTSYSTTEFEESFMKGDESFEFFSEEWLKNNKDSNFFPQDIIFGGNLSVSKQPISRNTQEFKKLDYETTKVDANLDSRRNREFTKLISMNKGRNHGGDHEMKRVLPTSASMKSRWYYHGFGLNRNIPTEMDLGAIKSRQNRHRRNHSVGPQMKVEKNGGLHHEKGLGRLIRELSCDGQTRANSMVKASLVYIPRV